eukprot:07726_2
MGLSSVCAKGNGKQIEQRSIVLVFVFQFFLPGKYIKSRSKGKARSTKGKCNGDGDLVCSSHDGDGSDSRGRSGDPQMQTKTLGKRLHGRSIISKNRNDFSMSIHHNF